MFSPPPVLSNDLEFLVLDPSKLYLKGYLKNETSIHTHSPHDVTKIKNIFHLELKYTFNNNLKLFTLGRVFWDSDNDIKDDKDLESWEFYMDLRLKDFDLRVGRQQVVWGEADGLRINDIINPQDFKEFILQDYIDSRIPLWMGKIDYYLYYMLGCDYHVLHNVDLSFQFIQKAITHHDKHFSEDNVQNSLTLFIQTDFLHETLKPVLLLVYGANEGDFWISPKVSYDISDTLQVVLGGEFFEGGNRQSFFGQFNSNDQVYCEVKYSFDY